MKGENRYLSQIQMVLGEKNGNERTRRQFMNGTATVTCIGLAGCLGDNEADTNANSKTDPDHVIIIEDTRFIPNELYVASGDHVIWINEGRSMETVTADRESLPEGAEYFASGNLNREVSARIVYPIIGGIRHGESYTHQFEIPGEYRYFSIPSEGDGMSGVIVVE